MVSPTPPLPPVEDETEPHGFDMRVHLAPIQHDQEWANALTHAFAAILFVIGGVFMYFHMVDRPLGTIISCLAFVFSATSVFIASALSHTFIDDAVRLERLRAWDQGLIYVMITGTYTPLVYHFADPAARLYILAAIWGAAFLGFYSKVNVSHRINSIETASYLALGWLPALALIGNVPRPVLMWMSLGGVLYTLGVAVLLNDKRYRYVHAMWHLIVMTAAGCHYWAIYRYVA